MVVVIVVNTAKVIDLVMHNWLTALPCDGGGDTENGLLCLCVCARVFFPGITDSQIRVHIPYLTLAWTICLTQARYM